jgi:hypothetical protein
MRRVSRRCRQKLPCDEAASCRASPEPACEFHFPHDVAAERINHFAQIDIQGIADATAPTRIKRTRLLDAKPIRLENVYTNPAACLHMAPGVVIQTLPWSRAAATCCNARRRWRRR